MHELTEIETSASHSCKSPHVERWHVLEPVSGRWLWLKVYACCSLVYEEPSVAEADEAIEVRKAA